MAPVSSAKHALSIMQFSLITPTALWLLLLLIPIWALAFAVPRRFTAFRFWSVLLLRSAMIVSLVLSVAGAQIGQHTSALTTIFLLDQSDSIGPTARTQAEQFVRTALQQMGSDDQAAIVTFGGTAQVAQLPSAGISLDQLPQVVQGDHTNLEDAITLGLSLFPAETNKRLVLLSDGNANSGNALLAAQQAAVHHIPLNYVALGAEQQPEALVSDLRAPSQVHVGQNYQLELTVESSLAQQAQLRVIADDQTTAFDQQVQLQPGSNHFTIPIETTQAGFQHVRAELTPNGDTLAQNNHSEVLVKVAGAAQILLAEGNSGDAAVLQQALQQAGMSARVVPADQLPGTLDELARYDAIALVNAPASAIPAATMSALPAYVRDLGRGLLMIGGEQSFGLGGYSQTPVEEALPVSMEVPQQITRPDMAIMFVLDKSASMSACHCRGPDRETDGYFDKKGRFKLDLAKDAVLASAKNLNPNDVVGVVAFDKTSSLPFAPQSDFSVAGIQDAIGPLEPHGGTNLGAGLETAEQALKGIHASVKHVIVMTDGWSKGVDPLQVTQRMRSEGITISFVAEGIGSSPSLQQLADEGGGRYLPFSDINDIPQIFLSEVQRVSENFMVEQPFTPAYAAATPILSGLDQGLPQLYGYNGTTPKQTATVALTGPDDSPILAQWQYGLGKAAVWTSDLQAHWGKEWIGWNEMPRFAAQLVGWVLPTQSSGQLTTEARVTDAGIDLTVTATNPSAASDTTMQAQLLGSGAQQQIALEQVQPGIFRGNLGNPTPGSYLVQINQSQDGTPIAQDTAPVVVPYSAEYRNLQTNTAYLQQLASITGGGELNDPKRAFAHTRHDAVVQSELSRPLLLIALLLLALDVVARRLLQQAKVSGR